MAQTALQKALQSVEDRMKVTKNEVRWGELNKVHIILKTLLPYERETIEAAHKDWRFNSAKDYFTKTYNTHD